MKEISGHLIYSSFRNSLKIITTIMHQWFQNMTGRIYKLHKQDDENSIGAVAAKINIRVGAKLKLTPTC